MNFARLVWRGASYRWKAIALLGTSSAVASAVLVGSLVVGDSVRASLRTIALGRLGETHLVVATPRSFRADLATGIRGRLGRGISVAAVWIAPAAVQSAESGVTAANAQVVGIDGLFTEIGWPSRAPLPRGRQAVVGPALASDLGLRPGAEILLTVAKPGAAPHHSLFARKRRSDAAVTLRLEVVSIAPDTPTAQFTLDADPATRRNVFVSRETLASAVGSPAAANALLVGAGASREEVVTALRHEARPEDIGFRVKAADGAVIVGSEAIALREREVSAVLRIAQELNAGSERVSANLATTVRNERTGREAAYAVVAFVEGVTAATANAWLAQDVGAKAGDSIGIRYLVPRADGTYATRTTRWSLRAVAAMTGDMANPHLAPEFEGVTSAKRISDWDPPFPVDQRRVTPRDEDYWRRYRAAPRLLLPEPVLREMWRGEAAGSKDWVTGVRLRPRNGGVRSLLAAVRSALGGLAASPASLVTVRDVRAAALRAAEGSTEFSSLFVGLGSVLILSSAYLTSLLMRLQCERRAREVGLLLAVGLAPRSVRTLLVGEGAAAAVAGAACGAAGGVGYADWVLWLLRTRWLDAIRTPLLVLDVRMGTIATGLVAGVALCLLSLVVGSASVLRRPAVGLLRGSVAAGDGPVVRASGRLAQAMAAFVLGAAIVAAGHARLLDPVGAFFGAGTCLLVGGLFATHAWLCGFPRGRLEAPSLWLLARRNAARHAGHSLAVMGTVAASAFIIVAVAANSRDSGAVATSDRASGAGGFELVAISALPLPSGMDTPAGRRSLGFSPQEEQALEGSTIIGLPMADGDDVSCLNVSRPAQPRLLGVPDQLVERGGFRLITGGDTPGGWRALRSRPSHGGVPAFGDAASVQWTLRSRLGGAIRVRDGAGGARSLRIVGVLPGSIFAGELLIADEQLREMFPTAGGPRYFLIDVPEGRSDEAAVAIRRAVGDLGVSVRTTQEVLSDIASVQRAYLAMFGVLGGLGILLGTLGLSTVVARNAVERRQELAALLAIGFSRRALVGLLTAEHVGLLIGGLGLGSVSALVAVWPQFMAAGAVADWRSVLAWLAAVGAVGVVACALGGLVSVRGPLVEALRSE